MTDETVWMLEPHTAAKHSILRNYLAAWLPIMSKYNKRIMFFDGFAGPGIYKDGEPGSPVIILDLLATHNYQQMLDQCEFVLLFNEVDPKRFAVLQDSIQNYLATHSPLHVNIKLELRNENFSSLVNGIIGSLNGQPMKPVFAFVDPFGYRDISMTQLAEFLASSGSELFIYFDFNSVVRFGTAGNVDGALSDLFGSNEFRNAPPSGDPERGQYFANLYERQLREVLGFPYIQRFEMRNRSGKTGNYLFFCTRNLAGLRAMKDSMWKIDPSGGFSFSDRLAGMDVLFGGADDTTALQVALAQHFAGQTVSIERVQEYVLTRTPYREAHVKRKTLVPMQKEGKISSPNQVRIGQFPDGTQITFH